MSFYNTFTSSQSLLYEHAHKMIASGQRLIAKTLYSGGPTETWANINANAIVIGLSFLRSVNTRFFYCARERIDASNDGVLVSSIAHARGSMPAMTE